MKFWCFHFEGYFSSESAEHPREGVFSSCLVQSDEYVDAEFIFIRALSDHGINLIEIDESFLVDTDPEKMDPTNEHNTSWFEWCEETIEAGKPTFDVFNMYPAAEVTISKTDN
jgi:hypothetical protein